MTIFKDDVDRRAFMVRLHRLVKQSDFDLAAYCLMSNHLHLIARAVVSLSGGMSRLLTSYAQHFNERWERVGHVFQNRFKLKRCLTDGYLKTAVRYVNLNPVKAQIVSAPQDWAWSSYREYLDPEAQGLTNRTAVLGLFEGGLSEFRAWTEDIDVADLPEEAEFVSDHDLQDGIEEHEIPFSLDELALGVMAQWRVSPQLFRRSKTPLASEARRTFILRASKLGYRGADLSRFLGISAAAISATIRRNTENVEC